MRTIPQIRARLHELAEEYGIPELSELAEETRRRPPARRKTRKVHPALTEEQEAEIRGYAAAFPDVSYAELARIFDTGIRCISYAIAGRREAA